MADRSLTLETGTAGAQTSATERDSGDRSGRKLRILLIADLCSPAIPSVALEGYSLSRALARRDDLDVTLVTHIRNRATLERDVIAGEMPIEYIDAEFIAVPLTRLAERFRKNGLSWTTAMAFYYPTYLVFEQIVSRRFKTELRAGAFDLVHRLTPISPTVASPLAYKTRTPMVVGPINGGLPWPAEYPDLGSKEGEYLRKLRFLYKYLPFNVRSLRRVRGLIAGSRFTASEVPGYFRGKRYYVPENGIDPERVPIADGWPEPAPGAGFRFVTLGRLVPYKGMDMIIEALHGSEPLQSARLTVIGDGPERPHLEALAARLGLSDRVEFTGNLDHAQVASVLRGCQAFAFPSLREFGGAVVLEAMACGLPPIVVDYGGPGEHVTPECGIAIPMAPRGELIHRLRAAMESLASDHDRCRRLAASALARVRDGYTWDAKAAQIVDVYRDVLKPATAS